MRYIIISILLSGICSADTSVKPGMQSIYIKVPSIVWAKTKLQENAQISKRIRDILTRTTLKSEYTWHSKSPTILIDGSTLLKISKELKKVQTWLLSNIPTRCYDKVTIQPFLKRDEDL